MDADTIGVEVGVEHDRIVIGVFLLVVLETIPAPGVIILLYADNIGILREEIVTYHLEALLVLVVTTISADVIAHDFKGTFRHLLLPQVKWYIYRYRYVRDEKAQQGNPYHAKLEDNPEKQKSKVDEQEKGECHPEARQHWMVGRTQPVGIANQYHDDDGDEIRACQHLNGECL
jgi:hypothetical protein